MISFSSSFSVQTQASRGMFKGQGGPLPQSRHTSSLLPDPGIKPGSPALQVDSLPPELSGKPPPTQTIR